ncbi:MAG: helix-turn-helix domain-containing protein [Akkermansiaceae bacterium]
MSLFHVGKSAEGISATRFGSSKEHDFLILSLPEQAIEQSFGSLRGSIRKSLGILRRWTNREEQFFYDIVSPPVPQEARQSWFLAKTLEILSLHLFQNPSHTTLLFCTTIKGNAHRHVREALSILQARLDEPLDLRELSGDIGCAPHYLSRLVKQGTGKPLSLHLRQFRIEKAAELLAGNQFNVTEVALEVGYQSLSHFSKAFMLEKGMTPSQFLRRTQSANPENQPHS